MQEAGKARSEAERLQALRELEILDTPPEQRFDRYTRIAAQAFDMPMALISLVDRERQWFKSAVGISATETPREISFCGHTILGDDIFEVQNARLDPRFRDNPLVAGPPRIRFYAGAPLKAASGHRVGTLCVIDRIPRALSEDEREMLERLAEMVAGELDREPDSTDCAPVRTTETTSGADFFERVTRDRDCSVLLFDIDDVLDSHDPSTPDVSPGTVFAYLLHERFPGAREIAHIGDYHFCVALGRNPDFDETRAVSHLCSDAKKLLCFAEGHQFLSPYVGRMHNDPTRYPSVDDMLAHAERMFEKHERQPTPRERDLRDFLKGLVGKRRSLLV